MNKFCLRVKLRERVPIDNATFPRFCQYFNFIIKVNCGCGSDSQQNIKKYFAKNN